MDASQFYETIHLAQGDLLFKKGDSTSHFYIVQSGDVEIYLEDDENKKILLAVSGPGQAIGEFALITKSPRSASARALTDVELVKISEEGYQNLLKDLPDWALSMVKSLIERLVSADETIRKHSIENKNLQDTLAHIMNGPTHS